MTQDHQHVPGRPIGGGVPVEDAVRQRVRALRQERGWSLDELAARSHLGPSTLSRIETGQRRLALDHLVVLARAFGVSVDDLLGGGDEDDVIIRPRKASFDGATTWMLSRAGEGEGKVVAKMRVPARKGPMEPKVHAGREWFLVLSGTARLLLGEREHLVREGEAAEFSTLTPHAIAGYGKAVEILSIFDQHGEAAHLRAR